jgi:uncharacterized membrane protein HdeD (DUF308 family)
MSTGTDLHAVERRLTWAWLLLFFAGLLGIVAGIIVLAEPGISLATLAVVTGIFLLVDGLFEIPAAIFGQTPNRGLLALTGVLSVITGVILLRHPIAGVVAIALLLGIWLIAMGVVRLMQAFDALERRGWQIVLSLLEVVAGIIIVASPDIGVATLALLVGISFIVRGLVTCAVAWLLHGAKRGLDRSGRGAIPVT